jgi:hypothetical protein
LRTLATADAICDSSGSTTPTAPLLPYGLSGFGWRTRRVGSLGGRSGPRHGDRNPRPGIDISCSPSCTAWPRAGQDESARRITLRSQENTNASRYKKSAFTNPPSTYTRYLSGVHIPNDIEMKDGRLFQHYWGENRVFTTRRRLLGVGVLSHGAAGAATRRPARSVRRSTLRAGRIAR